MDAIYDTTAPKKPTNLFVNADLLSRAKERGVNLSALFEAALVEELRERAREEWAEENRAAIDAYNKQVREKGLFSDGLRTF